MPERPSTAERLLEAAIELIDTGGEAAVRIDAVAASAGVKRPSVYHFFGDREGLVVAAQAERYRRTLFFGMPNLAKIVRACATPDEFVRLLTDWMRLVTAPDGEARRRIRIQVLGSAASRPELRVLIEAADTHAAEQVAQVIAIAQDRGWTGNRFDPEVGALWWFGMMNGRFLVEGNRSPADREQWNTIATEAVIRLFGEPPTPRR